MTPRITPEQHAEREARAVAMLRAGHTSDETRRLTHVTPSRIKALRAEHAIPKLPSGKAGWRSAGDCITHMSHAELDALAARVAADRAAGLLPPIA